MEAECGVPPPAQHPDPVKDATVADALVTSSQTIPIFFEEASSYGQTNGSVLDEGIPYDPSEFTAEGEPATEVEAASDQISEPVIESISPQPEATNILTQEDVSEPYQGTEESTESLMALEKDISLHDRTAVQVEIESVKEEVTGEKSSMLGTTVVEAPEGGGDGYDVELHVILEPSAGNIELAQLAEMTGDAHTQDLLAELQAHHDALGGEDIPGGATTTDNNNYHKQEEVLNRKELLDILEGNEPDEEKLNEHDNIKNDLVLEESKNKEGQCYELENNASEIAGDGDKSFEVGHHELLEPCMEVVSHEEVISQESDETLVAMRQLSSLPRVCRNTRRLRTTSAQSKNKTKHGKRGRPSKASKILSASAISTRNDLPEEANDNVNNKTLKKISHTTSIESTELSNRKLSQETATNSKDLIKVLVEDWEDDDMAADEPVAEAPVPQPTPTTSDQSQVSEQVLDLEGPHQLSEIKDIEATPTDNTPAKSSLPERRVSRVIKKKVIFDPDNPDTFTSKKSLNNAKSKSPQGDKEHREHPPPKKIKTEGSPQRTNEKSPAIKSKSEVATPKPKEKALLFKSKNEVVQKSKEKSSTTKTKNVTLWKKPQPKNNKQHKRLTEVDRLLMDEGAVNMMYQLNSTEAEPPKGKRNIKTKAEYLKKINQNNTPESNEIKFRERRKESSKSEEVQARSGRLRNSLSNSVASPSVCEEYETHSADDSIIIRRHSSSSYSSSCLSPRRLSDFDATAAGAAITSPTAAPAPLSEPEEKSNGDRFNDVFMSDSIPCGKTESLAKSDCLSLKEKLSSKLSRVLNFKRKRDGKTDKLEAKQKKLKEKKNVEGQDVMPEFQKLSVTFEQRVAEISILKEESSSENLYSLQTLKELKSALEFIDHRQEVSVTLLTSRSGNLCLGLDLSSVLQQTLDKRVKAANEIANSVRWLFLCLEKHSKVVCAGVEGTCAGVGLALLALCDVVVASDRATFSLLAEGAVVPGAAVLTSHRKSLCRSLITEMMVFGRQLSASEALARGLVSRTLWPDRFSSELRAMVRDVAAQPLPTLQLKKRLLSLRNTAETKSSFEACLEAERDLLAAYWSSDEGQAALRLRAGTDAGAAQ